ncbi:MAG: caspase family protein [Saprospiraceae bacterium]|jgi:hypothetical protein|nr:caspase family protein [Saprospiraceae bacterium]
MSENRSLGGLPNSPQEVLKQGKNHFFAIGISSYEQFTPLSNARKDIENLAQILKDDYSFEEQTLLFDEEATRAKIINTLSELRRVIVPEDKLIIYYSGHGTEDDFDGYWIPIDAQKNEVSTYVTNADITNRIKAINARHILLISDSCFSASLLEQGRSLGVNDTTFDEMEKTKSRWAFVSGKAIVSDGDPGSNSPFAKGIIKHLEKTTDRINISLLADQVTKEVGMNYPQQPIALPLTFVGGEYGGQFIFVKKQTEQDDWATARREDDEGAYLAYQKKYPAGKYYQDADQRLQVLGDENEWKLATFRNAAFDYTLYLKKYEKGIHVDEAKSRLDEIEQQDLKDKEEIRKQEQEEAFRLAAEKKEKERAAQRDPKTPTGTKSLKNNPVTGGKNTTGVAEKSSNYTKYILFVIGTFIAVYGGYVWFSNHSKPAESAELVKDITGAPTPAVIIPPALTDDSREIEGKVLVVKNTLIPLKGATVTNKRNSLSILTDEVGNYKLAQTKDGDTLLTTYNDEYYESINIVEKDQKSIVISLKPIIRVNKTITGMVEDITGNPVNHAWVYVERNGKPMKGIDGKYGTHSNSQGKYTLTKVNEGDLLKIDIGTIKYHALVTKDNMYNIINGKEITGSH